MFIYNTTYLVSEKAYSNWIEWLQNVHIPYMQNAGFTQPQLAKILTDDLEQEGSSLSLQFHIADLESLLAWDKAEGEAFQAEVRQKFGDEVHAFSTGLELI